MKRKPTDPAVEATRRMLLDNYAWPHLVLPMKRYFSNRIECGIVTETSKPYVVYAGNIFDGVSDRVLGTYESIDALLEDGWVVD